MKKIKLSAGWSVLAAVSLSVGPQVAPAQENESRFEVTAIVDPALRATAMSLQVAIKRPDPNPANVYSTLAAFKTEANFLRKTYPMTWENNQKTIEFFVNSLSQFNFEGKLGDEIGKMVAELDRMSPKTGVTR